MTQSRPQPTERENAQAPKPQTERVLAYRYLITYTYVAVSQAPNDFTEHSAWNVIETREPIDSAEALVSAQNYIGRSVAIDANQKPLYRSVVTTGLTFLKMVESEFVVKQ